MNWNASYLGLITARSIGWRIGTARELLLAYLSGGRAYGKKVATGLVLCLAAAVSVRVLMH
jgi:hypothetical protein